MTSKIRNFQIQNRLGSGSYGVIFKAINKNDKQPCVMKQIRMNKMSQKNKKSTLMQATIMGKLNHPFIVQYKDSFIDNDTLHIVMQYCDNGDLSMYLKLQNKKPLKQQKIWKFFIQICMGLEYIHRNKILHRDIKTLNIFLNKNQDVKIGDLGVAKMLMSNDFAQTVVGTPYYLSPQLCQQKPYNQKSDIWALGCLLYQLCTYKHPFQAANQASLILKIIRGKYSPIPEFYSKQLKDMIDLCLQRDYKRRPTANMILTRPKIKQFIKDFALQEKVNQFYQKLKANKQNKNIPINDANKVDNKKQNVQKTNVFIPIPPKPVQKQQPKKVEPINSIKKLDEEKDKKISQFQQKKPTVSGMPQKNIILPDKNRIIQKLQSNNLEKNKYLNVVKHQQNQKKIKQNKQQFLKNLQSAVQQTPKKQISSKEKPKNSEIISVVNEQKSRLQKIDIKIQEQLKKEKQIQKNKVNSAQENKKSEYKELLASPQRPEKNPLVGERRSLPFMMKELQNKNKQVLIKPSENPLMPPLPPKNKDQVIRVKMDQPPIPPKVFDSNNSKSRGVIKSKGFNQQIIQSNNSNEKKGENSRIKNKEQKKPVLFGLDQSQKGSQLAIKTPAKQSKEGGMKGSQYHSEKNIKMIPDARSAQNNNSVFQKAKQSQHYLFKKKPQIASNNSASRVRKGSGSMMNQDLSRNAKNASRYKQVTKQQQDMVMNLPDRPGNNYEDTSSDEQLKQPSEINMNKKFQLKDINNSIVLQKYQEILSTQSIESSRYSEKSSQPKIQPKKKEQNSVRINKNLNQYDQEQDNKHYIPQQNVQDHEIDGLLMNSLHQDNQNQDQIYQNDSLIQKTQQFYQNEDQIADQSQQMIDSKSNSQKGDQIQEQIYEINKYNLQDQEEVNQNQNDNFWNQQPNKKQNTTGQTQQWSFDQDPQLPMLQQKQSPYFQQANPYLVQQEQQDTLQQKRNYLQIRLQQNMKREDQINKLMQIKIQQCKSIVPKYFNEILQFFRKKINMDDQYTENDEKQVQQFLRKKGLTDQRKFQNIYKIMHFEMELQNTRTIIKRICKKLSQLDGDTKN